MATVLLFKDTHGPSFTCTLTMSAWLKPWTCIQRYRTCRAVVAGTSTVALEIVPFAPTTSIGRVTTLADRELATKSHKNLKIILLILCLFVANSLSASLC